MDSPSQTQTAIPRAITVPKTARIILIGGFLGAGKTTALNALARSLTAAGLRAGLITNDQTTNLVDTRTLGRLPLPIREVAGGCFCCRFDELMHSVEQVMETEPDVLLCEPVGSCTDMAATVLAPLQRYYHQAFTLAPFTVLVDPDRLEERAALPESVRYILDKQMEEADFLTLTKCDTLSDAEIRQWTETLAARWKKPVLPLSALRGDGMDNWQALLLGQTSAVCSLQEIDYDLYAEGEAVLGWLNATARVTGSPGFSAASLLCEVIAHVQNQCRREGSIIAHVKISMTSKEQWLRGNLTQTDGAVALDSRGPEEWEEAAMIVNARIAMAPERLSALVEEALALSAVSVSAHVTMLTLESFRPGYPTPPYRIP